ncbi:MAG: hypothetical protein EPO65_10260 [Dehalococcoidia bacterium]|nr:MAG: hypothetical protein EPO65_10260 [Dehalococcoidia bacterium]
MPDPITIREDVHIHVPVAAIHRRLSDPSTHDEWLSPHFQRYTADEDSCAFVLAIPGRNEAVRLRRDGSEARSILYVRDGSGAFDSVTWAMHVEGAHEVHLTVEVAYRPAGGPIGAVGEVMVHRAHRVQALRDSLWNLKHLLEREARAGLAATPAEM